ncbi:hypothetical protein PSPO01_11906 [Paraphaeosphaeria sporulosa]
MGACVLRIAHGAAVLAVAICSTQIHFPQTASTGADLLFSSMICAVVPPSSHSSACAPALEHGICPRRLPTVAPSAVSSTSTHPSMTLLFCAVLTPLVP